MQGPCNAGSPAEHSAGDETQQSLRTEPAAVPPVSQRTIEPGSTPWAWMKRSNAFTSRGGCSASTRSWGHAKRSRNLRPGCRELRHGGRMPPVSSIALAEQTTSPIVLIGGPFGSNYITANWRIMSAIGRMFSMANRCCRKAHR